MTFWTEMHTIVEREVESYKTDLLIDMRTIGRYGQGQYLWATRPTGTDIVPFPTSDWPETFVSSTWFTISMRSNHKFYMVWAYDDARREQIEPLTIEQVIACLRQMPTEEGQTRNLYLERTLAHPEFIQLHGKHKVA